MSDAAQELSREEIEKLIASVQWYHRFEILPGYITPGQLPYDADNLLRLFQMPDDMSGTRAVDIGTWDGPVAFELEKRGAEALGFDIQDPDATGFNAAKKLLKSNVRYVQGSVYDLPRFASDYDYAFFNGVYYHLKYPILGFESISRALKTGGLLLFSGECLINYAERLHGGVPTDNPALRSLAESEVPMTLCYPGRYKGASNWHVPNVACIRGWLEAAGFELVSHMVDDVPHEHRQSFYGTARKLREPIDEHPLVGHHAW